jgi:UDP-N-acetylglucosamine--dolichyl-phosphate N-acetylglucosaminephosphotransferase
MFELLLAVLITFIVTFLSTPKVARFLFRAGIVGIDQQKTGKPVLPSSGGLPVAIGLLAGLLLFIGTNTFLIKVYSNELLLAALATILIITLIGLIDDLNVGKRMVRARTGTKEYRIGLPQWLKACLVLPAALPLMAVAAGQTRMAIPFFGSVDFGIIYPLILVPIAVVCVANATNMLAGMNGLEAGLGGIASLSVGIFGLLRGQIEGAVIALILCAALLGFLKWNWFPAKILPGDSLTYLIGAGFVTAVILANIEMFGIFVFIPWIVEAFLKLRGQFKVSSLGVLQKDGSLKSQYNRIYSLTHILMRVGKFRERDITVALVGIEMAICVLAFLIFL